MPSTDMPLSAYPANLRMPRTTSTGTGPTRPTINCRGWQPHIQNRGAAMISFRTGLRCAVILALSVAAANAQVRVFMSPDGVQGSAPTTGPTTITLDPGTSQTVGVWMEDTTGAGDLLAAYQIIIPDTAIPLGGASGAVTYVNNNPGGGGGDSVVIDTLRPDWVFQDQIAVLPPTYNESPGQGIFGVFYATIDGFSTDPGATGGILSLVEFDLEVSAEACGAFELPFNLAPKGAPPFAALFALGGSEYFVDEYQPLSILINPANSDCVNAQTINDVDTDFCIALDQPDSDVYFEYQPLCDGNVLVSTCDQADFDSQIEVYAGCGICPPTSLIASNDDGPGCGGGTSEVTFFGSDAVCYTIRVIGNSPADLGGGTLTVRPQSCFIDGQCRNDGAPNPGNECEACNPALSADEWSPRPSDTSCTDDGLECTDDACDGAGTCAHPPLAGGTPCTDDGVECTDDTCNGAGACVHPPASVGTPCTDTDGNECTLAECDGAGACANPAPNGTPCTDDGNVCTDNACDGGGTCAANPNSNPCDDGLFCNGDDSCAGGTCSVHTGDPCAGGVCDEVLDECQDCSQNSDCPDDGNPCTDEVCLGGACSSVSNNAGCDDGLFCNGADLCGGGTCSIHTGNPCSGGAECSDVCDEGADSCDVAAGTPCTDDGDVCTDDVCDGAGACSHPPASAGTPCIDDGEVCTDDVCDGAGACSHPPAAGGTPCDDDGNECTFDECDGAGACAHPPVSSGTACADDGNECTLDECDGAGSCTHPSGPAGVPCDDGLPCTGTGEPGVGIDECDGDGNCVGMLDPSCADTCVDAAEAFEGANLTNNTGFGTEIPTVSCAVNSGMDTWYVHVANCSGLLRVTTTGSDFDTVLTAYDDCGGGEIACDDDGGPGLASSITISVTAGEDYFMRVAGFGGATGNVQLNITRLDTCFVDGVCHNDGASNPDNPCEVCDAGDDPDGWSPAARGTACGNMTPDDPQCDSPDSCDGMGVCETNHKPAGIACGDPSDTECDNPDTCNGMGSCVDNFETPGFACGDPTDTDCDNPDSCDGSGGCLDNFEPAATACGDPLDSQCDNPDTCDGGGTCLDNFEPGGTACGDPTDTDCDNPDSCDGGGACQDNFEPGGTACGDPTDTDCDNPDTCDGTGLCEDNFELPGTACGDPTMTECDNPDTCTLVGTCQPNYQLPGVACGDPTSTECDSPDSCDGSGACQDNFANAGTSCGDPTNTECDNPDTCDGVGDCADNLEPGGTACGDPLDDDCTNPDSCDGLGACLDNHESSGSACGDPTDTDCNNPDTCDGGGTCLDNFENNGTACGDPTINDCNGADTCNGSGMCQDNFEPIGLPCGDPTSTDCDGPDTCDGGGTCQDNFSPAGSPCGNPLDTDCDNPDTCDGGGGCDDNFEPDGTSCEDGMFCNGMEECLGGVCQEGEDPCVGAAGCDEENDECLACQDFTDCGDLDMDDVSDDNCMWYQCMDNECSSIPRQFADLGGPFGECMIDNVTDNNDRFHALNCFANVDTDGSVPYPCEPSAPFTINVDAGGKFGACCPDGVCDSNDAFLVLNAFAGSTTCSCPDACGGPAPVTGPVVTEKARLSLIAERGVIQAGQTIEVDVFMDSALKDLRGYQLHVEVSGGSSGSLTLVDMAIRSHPNYVFDGRGAWDAFNLGTAQMTAGLDTPGIATPRRGYLATLTLVASRDAAGTFAVDLLYDDTAGNYRTFLFPSLPTGKIAIDRTTPAVIRVGTSALKR